jgi:hypothetical protein
MNACGTNPSFSSLNVGGRLSDCDPAGKRRPVLGRGPPRPRRRSTAGKGGAAGAGGGEAAGAGGGGAAGAGGGGAAGTGS